MSNQFELENAIREATRMDTSISKTGWNKPRKALENSEAKTGMTRKYSVTSSKDSRRRDKCILGEDVLRAN